RIDVENLIPRVIESGGMNYWESGMDLHLSDNIFDSFRKYQKSLIEAYDKMAEEYNFEVLDARRSVGEIQEDLRARIELIIKRGGPQGNIVPLPGGSGRGSKESGGLKANAQEIESRLSLALHSIRSLSGEGPSGEERKPVPPREELKPD